MQKNITLIVIILLIGGSFVSRGLYAASIQEIDQRAQKYYEQKQFTKAIAEWLQALEQDPNNERIQQKVEMVYEEKHRKDLSKQKALLYLRLARKTLSQETLDLGRENAEKAIANFVIAYRIDPNDVELQDLKDKMARLQAKLRLELEKKRVSEGKRKEYASLLMEARSKMQMEQYPEALLLWNKMLGIFPSDDVALEGRRKSELAIENRLKFERIKALLAQGLLLFNRQQYNKALLEYNQVLKLDPQNDEAEEYIDKIEDFIDEQKNYERRKLQAEQFYVSGISNIKNNDFDAARDDFENVLVLINNYKDTVSRLRSIDRLEKDYQERLRRQQLEEIDREFRRGLLLFANRKYRDALASFEKLLRLDPKSEVAKRYIRTTKEALIQQQEEVVGIHSPYYSLVSSLIHSGKKLYDAGEYAKSRTRWEKILKLFPKNRVATEYLLRCDLQLNPESYKKFADTMIQEGKTLLKKKEFDNALKNFQLVASISPQYPGIAGLIAQARKGERQKQAPIVSPKIIETRYRNALSLYQRGDEANIRKALEQFKWIEKNDPQNDKVIIIINKIESQLRIGGSLGVTQTTGRQLTAKQKERIRTYYFNGINYYSNNKFDKAIAEWRKVLAIDPNHVKAKNNIRKCLILLREAR